MIGRVRFWTALLTVLLVAGLALGAALLIVDRAGERIIEAQARAAIVVERDDMATLAREQGRASLIAALDRKQRTSGAGGFRYALSDASGRPVAGSTTLADGDGAGHWQILSTALPSGEKLIVAQDLDARRSFRQAVFQASAIALLLSALAGTVVGLALTGALLRRANAIGAAAELIAEGQFHARVPATAEGGDVFDRLGRSLNAMLARIEELMTGMRTVTDSLAHDLRTPLTRLKGALARAADVHSDEASRRAALDEAQEQADDALATFSALLDIAQAETGLSRETMEETDLSALAEGVADLFSPLIEDADQTLVLHLPRAPVARRAHPLLLRQALGNLLHNASRYAGAGATVTLTLERVGGLIRLTVADNGPGVPEADLGRVQERFVRLDETRSGHGAGLGLAIVVACAKLHDGRLLLQDNKPGLRAVVEMVG